MRVVLPAPLAPSSPTTSPARTSRSTPATAVNAPKRRTTLLGAARRRGVRGRRARARSAPPARRPVAAVASPARSAVRGVARAAVLQQDDRGRALRLVEVGGGDDHRGAAGGGRGDQPPQLGAAHRVDAGRGLVEHEQLRLVQHREREGELLAHAAGEAAGEPLAGAGEAGLLAAGAPSRASRSGAAEAVGGGHEGDVLVDAEVVVHAGGAGDVADPAPRRAAARCRRLGLTTPASARSSVVLPAPSPPITAVTAPRGASRVTPSSAVARAVAHA